MVNEVIKVLLVDDDEDDFVLTRDLLANIRTRSYEIDWCSDYESAAEAVRSARHDVYLIDYNLGERSGIDLIRFAHDQGLSPAMIVLTGHADDRTDFEAMQAGATDYLIKEEISDSSLERAIRYATQQRKARAQLRLQAHILERVHDGVFLISPEGNILTWNLGAQRIYGYTAEEIIGNAASRLCERTEDCVFGGRTLDEIRRTGGVEMVRRHRCKSGDAVIIAMRTSVLEAVPGEPGGVIVCVSDITEQKRLEKELLELSESERRRIAMDIHDDLCQQLAGISCLTKVLEKNVAKQENVESVAAIGKMVAEANARARQLSRGLAPPVLDEDGLPVALEELAETTARVFGVTIDVRCDATNAFLGKAASIQLYRIAQEAITNAIKHGGAGKIAITLSADDAQIVLAVSDDGSGMGERHKQGKGMGVLGMRHRAQMLNGDLEIKTDGTKGTTVRCRIAFPFPGNVP